MKAIKYITMGALMLSIGTTAMAQDANSVISQVESVIKAGGDAKAIDKQVDNLAKPFKKDATVLSQIGEQYLAAGNIEKATAYADKAQQVSKNKSAAAYMLKGRIALHNDDAGGAAQWFEQAIQVEPQNPDGYRAYAMLYRGSNIQYSIDKLEELRRQRPDYPVDIVAGNIFDEAASREQNSKQLQTAVDYYKKADMNQMKESELGNFATDAFFTGDKETAAKVAEFGVQKYPENTILNRMGLYANTLLKNYDAAKTYSTNLFNGDKSKLVPYDYQMSGFALLGLNDAEGAVAKYKEVLDLDVPTADKAEAYKNMATAYEQVNDYTNAIDCYKKFLETKGAEQNANDLNGLATLYKNSTSVLDQDGQLKAIENADKVYQELVAKYPDSKEYALFQRAKLAAAQDPQYNNGKAKPICDELIDFINSEDNKDATSMTRLKFGYFYNMAYAYMGKQDVKTAKEYAAKVLEIDPNDETAKQVME